MGSLAGAWMTTGNFKPLHEVLQEMDPGKRRAIYDAFHEILVGLDYNDVNTLILLASSNDVVRAQMIGGLKNYVNGTMQMQIVD